MFDKCRVIVDGCLSMPSGDIDLSELTSTESRANLNYMFRGATGITSVDLSNLENGQFNSTFSGCTALRSVNLSSLRSISTARNMFSGCSSLESINLDNLDTISGSQPLMDMFTNCNLLRSFRLPSLKKTGNSYGTFNYMFRGCQNLESIDLSGLEEASGRSIFGGIVNSCPKLKEFKAGNLRKITDAYSQIFGQSIFSGCNNLEYVDFHSITMDGIEFTDPSYKEEAFAYMFNYFTPNVICNVDMTGLTLEEAMELGYPDIWYIQSSNVKVYFKGDVITPAIIIDPYPANATVTLTCDGHEQVGNMIEVNAGDEVSYTVSRNGLTPISGTVIAGSYPKTLNIRLTGNLDVTNWNYTQASDSAVTLNSYTGSSTSIVIPNI